MHLSPTQRLLAVSLVSEHCVSFRSMQHGQTGEHMARAVRDLCGLGGQPESSLRIPLTVELDKALPQQGKSLCRPVAQKACGVNGPFEVRMRGGIISAL
jgi:hypothetical protein